MSKLIFTYGVMGSSKTANALMQYFEATSKGKNVLLLKPAIDKRDGEQIIKSRIGLMQAAVLLFEETKIKDILCQFKNKIDLIIIDEAQFCEKHHIDELKDISISMKIPVYAYGLKTNFQSFLFEGSKRLLEIADEIRTLEKSCEFCDNAAEINARFDKKGNIIIDGDVVVLGGNDKYKSICYKCWKGLVTKNNIDK